MNHLHTALYEELNIEAEILATNMSIAELQYGRFPFPQKNRQLNWKAGWEKVASTVPPQLIRQLAEVGIEDARSLYLIAHNLAFSLTCVDLPIEVGIALTIDEIDGFGYHSVSFGEESSVSIGIPEDNLRELAATTHNHPFDPDTVDPEEEYTHSACDQSHTDWAGALRNSQYCDDDLFPQLHTVFSRDDSGELEMSLLVVEREFDDAEIEDIETRLLTAAFGSESAHEIAVMNIVGEYDGVRYFAPLSTGLF